jgi:hypothetical protein
MPPLQATGSFEEGTVLYFHGMLPRQAAEDLLSQLPLNAFLVRESETKRGSYTVSVRTPTSVKHFLVKKTNAALKYAIGDRAFPSMDSLVLFYRDYPIFTDKPTRVKILLKHPALRRSAGEAV